MTAKQSSFWSTTSGVVTGVAGTLTGVVGIATMATQLGWLGGDDDQTASETKSTTAAAAAEDGTDTTVDGRSSATTGRASRSTAQSPDAEPEYTVDPPDVSFSAIGGRTATVTVRNTGTVDVDVADVTVEGEKAVAFDVGDETCTDATLDPGRTCSIDLSFTPPRAGEAQATLVIEVDGAPAREVPVSGVALL